IAGAGVAASGATVLLAGGAGETAGAGEAAADFGPAWRATGRAFGNGTFASASASTGKVEIPRASARAMPARFTALRGKALLSIGDSEASRVTAILLCESIGRNICSSISSIMMPKHQMCRSQDYVRPHRGKIASGTAAAGPFPVSSD